MSNRPILVLFIASMLLFACGDDGGGDAPVGDTGDVGIDTVNTDADVAEDVADEPDVVSCEPNSIIRCVVENTAAVERCNFRGNEIFQGSCEGMSVCRNAECVEVACIPGERFCSDDSTPVVCNEDGTEFVTQNACSDGELCTDGVCLSPCELAERTASYIGCEYWPVELMNNLLFEESTEEAPFAVVLANPGAESAMVNVYTPEGEILDAIPEVYIMVTIPDPRYQSTTVYTQVTGGDGLPVGEPIEGPLENIEIPPQGELQILFPHRQPPPDASYIGPLAWRIQSNRPVVAYQFNPICCNFSFTNDASLLLPRGTLTENYIAMTYPNWINPGSTNSDHPGTLTIVAVDDDTSVSVRLPEGARIRPGDDVPAPSEGVITVNLDAQEVLNLASGDSTPIVDLSGSVVEASKPVAVFGGHSCTFIPSHLSACDHLEQQLFPVETWGQNYVAAPIKLRRDTPQLREATYWKFMARFDDTEIVLDRPLDELQPKPKSAPGNDCRDALTRTDTIALNAGEYCEFGTRIGFVANANNPVLLGAFMSGQESTGDLEFGSQTGDPAFFLIPPQEQWRTNYDFLTPATYALDFVTVVAPVNTRVTLDGELLELTDFEHEIIEAQNIISAHIPLADGPHRIESGSPFGIVVYAYDDFVSYAYTGGLDLVKLNIAPEE